MGLQTWESGMGLTKLERHFGYFLEHWKTLGEVENDSTMSYSSSCHSYFFFWVNSEEAELSRFQLTATPLRICSFLIKHWGRSELPFRFVNTHPSYALEYQQWYRCEPLASCLWKDVTKEFGESEKFCRNLVPPFFAAKLSYHRKNTQVERT